MGILLRLALARSTLAAKKATGLVYNPGKCFQGFQKQGQEAGLEGPVQAPAKAVLCLSLPGPCLYHQLPEEGDALGVWERHQKERAGEQPG